MNSKVKFVLYLLVSEFFIGLNDQNYVSATTLAERMASIGRSKPATHSTPLNTSNISIFQSVMESTNTGVVNTRGAELSPESTTTTTTPVSSAVQKSQNTLINASIAPNEKTNVIQQNTPFPNNTMNEKLIQKFYEIERKLKEKADHPDFTWINVNENNGIDPRTPISDRFSDESFVVIAASHGLHFKPYARAHIFMDQFDHFLKFTIPKQPILSHTDMDCVGFYVQLFEADRARNKRTDTSVPTHAADGAGADFCEEHVKVYNSSIDEMQTILDNAYSSFKSRTINKRFIGGALAGAAAGAITGAAAGALAGYLVAKHYMNGLENKINALDNEMKGVKEATKTNTEQLIGLSKRLASFEKEVNDKFKVTEQSLNKQVNILKSSITSLVNSLNEEQRTTYFREGIQEYISYHLNSQRNLMILELENLNLWEEIFTVLVESKLPVKLINYNQLKSILTTIKETLPQSFEFGIEPKEFLLYYQLPLTSFAVQSDGDNFYLIVYFKIPLKLNLYNTHYDVINVVTHPFPCMDKNCAVEGSSEDDRLQKFDLQQTSWLINTQNNHLSHEVNLDYLDCISSGDTRTCWSFSNSLLQAPSDCAKAIFYWEEDKIINWCDFKSASKSSYKIIPMKTNYYLIHQEIVNSYLLFCSPQGETVSVTHWALTVEIPKFCEIVIQETHQKLVGSFGDILRSVDHNATRYISSSLVTKIDEKYRNITSQRTAPDSTRLIRSIEKNFNESKEISLDLTEKLTNQQINILSIWNANTQAKLNKALNALDQKVKTYRYTWSFWGNLGLVSNFLQMLTTLTVIFGIVSYSNIFGWIAATIVVIRPQATAWEFSILPKINLIDLPDITANVLEDTQGIAFLMNCVFLVIFFVLLILFVVFGVFRKIEFSQHYGKYNGQGRPLDWRGLEAWENPAPSTLMLHLHYRANHFRCVKVEHIHLKVSIDDLFSEGIREIKVKNPQISWAVIKINGKLTLKLSEIIHLLGFNASGIRIEERDYDVEIPVKSSEFNSNPASQALRHNGNNGLAFIDIVVKRRISPFKNFESQENVRYTAVVSPSAPSE